MATSRLQKAVGELLDKTFPHLSVKENHRPEWLLSSNLTRLELDFYIEEIKTAFEIQGIQHFEYTPFFHSSYDDFEKRKQYDIEKKDLCYGAGITLIEICSLMDAIVTVKTLDEKLTQRSHGVIYVEQEQTIRPNRKKETLGEWTETQDQKIRRQKLLERISA